MIHEVGRFLFALGAAAGFGATALHWFRVAAGIFAVLPVWPAAALSRAVGERYHRLASALAVAAGLGVLLQGTGSPAFRERLIAVTLLALLHAGGSVLLAAEGALRDRIASLGAGASADDAMKRFDRLRRLGAGLDGLALAIGFCLVAGSALLS